MASQAELLQEAYSRGILPPEKADLYEEAVKRGLIEDISLSTDTSPIDLGKQEISAFGRRFDSMEELENDPMYQKFPDTYSIVKYPTDEEVADAQRGVDTRTGSTEGRFQQSWMPEGEKAPFIKEQLIKKLGKDTSVRKNQNGRIEFINPKTKRWTTFDEYGFGLGDLKDMFGESLTLVGDIIGSVAGYRVGGAGGEAIGSGIGTFIGEEIKLNTGKLLGYHDLEQDEIATEARGKAGIAAAATGVGRGVMAAGHRAYYGKQLFSDEQASVILEASKDSNKVVDDINRRISGEHKVAPTMGERSQMDSVMDVEATIQHGTPNIQNAVIIREQKRESEKGLEEFFDEVSGVQRADIDTAGRGVKGKFDASAERKLMAQEARITGQEATAEAGKLPEQDIGLSGKNTRRMILDERKKVEDLEEIWWEQYKKDANYDARTDLSDVKIPRNKELDSLIATMKKEKKHAIFAGEGKNKGKLLDSKLLDEKGSYDLVHIQRSLNYLKKQLRISSKGLSSEEPDVGDLKRIVGKLQGARNEYLLKHNPELLRQIENAEALTKYKNDIFDEGVIGTVLRKKGDNYVLDDEGVFLKMFGANNKSAAREYASILMDDPRAMQGARNTILALYNKTVVKDGIPDKKLHDSFMKNYGGTVDVFFNKSEQKQVKRLGGLANLVVKYNDKIDQYEKLLKTTFRGKIKSLAPREIVNSFFKNPTKENAMTGLNVDEVARLRNYLDSYGKKELDHYKSAILSQFKERVTRNGRFNPLALRKMLDATGDLSGTQKGKLGTMFGAQYAKDMRTLLSAVDMVEKKGVPLPKTPEPALWTLIKLYLGPLHRTSRFSTKAGQVQVKAADRAILEAILNPDKLHALVASKSMRQNQKQTAAILSSLGALSLQADQQ